MAGKIDFKKTLAVYRAKQGVFEVVDVPTMQYLMIDGHGDPNSAPAFAEAIRALYPVAYKLKFASKRELDRDFVVPPLEARWWADDMSVFTTARDKSQWDWTLMMMVPDWINSAMFEQAIAAAGRGGAPAVLRDVRLESLAEGTCVQTLHIGSFDDEAPVLHAMHHEFIPSQGSGLAGQHHEIYLSDFRKVEASKRRTILRQPVIPR
jgi:hypothetical protein